VATALAPAVAAVLPVNSVGEEREVARDGMYPPAASVKTELTAQERRHQFASELAPSRPQGTRAVIRRFTSNSAALHGLLGRDVCIGGQTRVDP
jgi:hypothetical protein